MDAAFYFDLASPAAYLVAERILQELPVPVEWQPVFARDLEGESTRETPASIARGASALGIQPLRWPTPFPFDSERAMLAATYAKSIGRTIPFAQAAFRQAFAGGRDLGQLDSIVIAAAACEMHPQAVLRGIELRSVRERLAAGTRTATFAGVREVPAVRVGEEVFDGPRMLVDARRALRAVTEMGGQKNAKSDQRDRADGLGDRHDRADGPDDQRDRADLKMDFLHSRSALSRKAHASADPEHTP